MTTDISTLPRSMTPPSPAEVDALVRQHLPLVGYIVRDTMNRVPAHVDSQDLAAAGALALVQACGSFNPERGVPFASYARTRIRGAILDELRGTDWASRSVRRVARSVAQTRTSLTATLGHAPTDAEVASVLGISVADIAANDDDVSRARLDALPVSDDEDPRFNALSTRTPGPQEAVEHREQLSFLVAAIAELPEKFRAVIEDYFLADLPMVHIAERLGVTESRVSQMRAEALVLLRDAINASLDPHLVPPQPRPNGAKARRRAAYHEAVAIRQKAIGLGPLVGAL